ncbi:aminodeoxychorismate synthase component I [Rhodoblastus acidophilus]|uniref:Aminodeoxychorismate synthase component I n=1 Tax=Candidatus Rhodoblastus alkanivorans TaxID=2954117 RepID=A0ABS9Z336_9HYPH|nr:aminodeoxychorismate synthase component I [Candidatus Rhodoblastus alkanivorans]MCI4677517.1 aminodeoxychorismate synthase component I [Candidatus Rhodoblastus alkanivorans]MCI4681876.1 aminodeoxychorismate synthase component I [Candidatus Rhodoblastus alkanivorans]MDI4642926.1 aminodeoxychorismate synthase component I [Rhodoblastus acidophilus]
MDAPFCLIEDREAAGALLFTVPRKIVAAYRAEEVGWAFTALQAAVRENFYVAGFVAYECGYAFEPRLAPLLEKEGVRPLLLFGVFDAPHEAPALDAAGAGTIEALRPAWNFADYAKRFAACRDYIAAGDAYQVNLTFPIEGRWRGEPLDLYRNLRARQPVALGGIVALGGETILSLSPERFFFTRGDKIFTRPMKGTAPRGATPEEDQALVEALARSEKNRAENLMIVDLLRNDLSRLSEVGSVKVSDLFSVETFPTLHQMTSGVEARLRPGLALQDIFAGLFPCGSVTGAPKIRAMEIIAELENVPRGVYCGAFGFIAPGGDMRFNVAIRTLTLAPDGKLTCPVGSAVVADSHAQEEYEECLLKARFLTGEPISA